MANYVYIQSEPGLWTVGIYNIDGGFQPESDHGSADEAAARVHYLNGGSVTPPASGVKVGKVYRFTWRSRGRRRPPGVRIETNTLNRQRLDGADVLVVDTTDGASFAVEALDGTIFQVWQDELTDVASTPADRFASFTAPTVPLGVAGRLVNLNRDESVADSVVNETAEHLSRDLAPMERAETRDASIYALGVVEYARYLRTGEASDQLRKLLDI